MWSRQVTAELMDDPSLGAAAHRDALRGLASINHFTRSPGLVWRPIQGIARRLRRSVRVLDLACGGGDVTIALRQAAQRAALPVEVDGCDLSPTALALARENAGAAGAAVRFFRLNAVHQPLPTGYDVITSSLFLHHLPLREAETLLGRMAGAADHVVVSDLERCAIGYWAAWLSVRVLCRSPIVHADGPASVRAAFTLEELSRLASAAGLAGARVSPRWPFRLVLEWSRA
jgi:SAM-dependent methyltransferase